MNMKYQKYIIAIGLVGGVLAVASVYLFVNNSFTGNISKPGANSHTTTPEKQNHKAEQPQSTNDKLEGSARGPQAKKQTDNDDIRLLLLGDAMFEEPLFSKIQNENMNPFEHIQDAWTTYDAVILNLETPIDGHIVGSAQAKPYTFSAPAAVLSHLKKAGITAVSYANNHTRDYGAASVTHTISLLEEQGIGVFGAGANTTEAFAPWVFTKNNTTIALLGTNSAEYAFNIAGADLPGTAFYNKTLTEQAVRTAKQKYDIVIMFTHWGTEQTTEVNALQKEWAKHFTASGADLVVGAHPHVLQSYEQVNEKPVFYSLGNIVFPGMAWNPDALVGGALEIIITDNAITNTNLHTVQLNTEGIPTRLETQTE